MESRISARSPEIFFQMLKNWQICVIYIPTFMFLFLMHNAVGTSILVVDIKMVISSVFNCYWLAPGNSMYPGSLSSKLRLLCQLIVLTQGYPKSKGGTFLLAPKGVLWGVKVWPPQIEQYETFFYRLSVLHFSTEKPQIQPVCIKSDALEGLRSKIRVTKYLY